MPTLLSDAEQADYDRLAAWFLTWAAPTEPYSLAPHLTVTEPALNHAYLAACIREQPKGQVQRALLVRLRLLANA